MKETFSKISHGGEITLLSERKEVTRWMANFKVGLDYFPLDCFAMDDKIKLLEIKCGIEAFAILVKLWQKIYAEGYYIKWSEDSKLLFAGENRISMEKLNQVIEECFNRGLFSKAMYEKYEILTSKGIQKRYLFICKQLKRKQILMNKNYVLVTDSELLGHITELCIENTEFETQKKRKERKRKERKGKESTPQSPQGDELTPNSKTEDAEKLCEILMVERSSGDSDKESLSKTRAKNNTSTVLNNEQLTHFQVFWKEWPKRISRAAAERAWKKINPDEDLTQIIVHGVQNAKKFDKRFADGFIPNAATWLNAEGWTDEFTALKHAEKKISGGRYGTQL